MKYYIPTLMLTTLLIGLQSCKTPQHRPETYDGRQVIFGNGGGFTGAVDTYVLLENGQLFNQESLIGTTYQELASLDRDLTDQLFGNYQQLDIGSMKINMPGDQYYFVEMKEGSSQHRVTWGSYEVEPPRPLKQYYLNLFKLAQKQKKLARPAAKS